MVVYQEAMEEEAADTIDGLFVDETPIVKVDHVQSGIPMVWFPLDFHLLQFNSSMGAGNLMVQDEAPDMGLAYSPSMEETANEEQLQGLQQVDNAISVDDEEDNVVYITDSASEDSECEIILEYTYRTQDKNMTREKTTHSPYGCSSREHNNVL